PTATLCIPFGRGAAGFPSLLARARDALDAPARFCVRADFALVADFDRALVCRFASLAMVLTTPAEHLTASAQESASDRAASERNVHADVDLPRVRHGRRPHEEVRRHHAAESDQVGMVR